MFRSVACPLGLIASIVEAIGVFAFLAKICFERLRAKQELQYIMRCPHLRYGLVEKLPVKCFRLTFCFVSSNTRSNFFCKADRPRGVFKKTCILPLVPLMT